ncbi:hypothetical protein HMPREF0063_10235 [Aeromicrobium marinum DSM 15272]|uniref:Mce-associated membrane protein n=1 Tax=Aeromicrobium marinum DSM 15272 TaxID=585531 RepID=E2S878_9ACTN|nr:hypothetical protein HMPREF0063_10235 [Aeromicrobium marinum DSM 15272]
MGHGAGRVVLISLLVAAVVSNVGLRLAVTQAEEERDTGRAALESATTRIPAMLSYDFGSFDSYVELAVGNTTGDFGEEMRLTLREQIQPDAEARQIVNEVQVTSAGVQSAGKGSVTVLMLLTQVTQSGSEPPVTGGFRVLATMSETDEGWFVSDLEPV